jgi:hypothetical protein
MDYKNLLHDLNLLLNNDNKIHIIHSKGEHFVGQGLHKDMKTPLQSKSDFHEFCQIVG